MAREALERVTSEQDAATRLQAAQRSAAARGIAAEARAAQEALWQVKEAHAAVCIQAAVRVKQGTSYDCAAGAYDPKLHSMSPLCPSPVVARSSQGQRAGAAGSAVPQLDRKPSGTTKSSQLTWLLRKVSQVLVVIWSSASTSMGYWRHKRSMR